VQKRILVLRSEPGWTGRDRPICPHCGSTNCFWSELPGCVSVWRRRDFRKSPGTGYAAPCRRSPLWVSCQLAPAPAQWRSSDLRGLPPKPISGVSRAIASTNQRQPHVYSLHQVGETVKKNIVALQQVAGRAEDGALGRWNSPCRPLHGQVVSSRVRRPGN
jgi:hypothetical protein